MYPRKQRLSYASSDTRPCACLRWSWNGDADIIAYAMRHEQVVLTFDLDYPALLALNPSSRASAIIFRPLSAEPEWINQRLSETLALLTDALTEGAIVVVDDHRIRVRRFLDLWVASE